MDQNDEILINNEELKTFIKNNERLKNTNEKFYKNLIKDIHIYTRIIESAKETVMATFASIYGVKPEYQNEKEAKEISDSAIGIISISENPACSILLVLPRVFAVEAALKFTGMKIDFDTPDMNDFVGEMANIIAGDIAARIDSKEIKGKLSLPKTIKCEELLKEDQANLMFLSFSLPQGNFRLGIRML